MHNAHPSERLAVRQLCDQLQLDVRRLTRSESLDFDRRVRLQIEDAAAEVGDRAVVACAIARAALAIQSSPATSLGMADCAVVERVATMLAGPSQRSVVLEAAFTGVAIAGAVGLAVSLALLGHMLPALRICL